MGGLFREERVDTQAAPGGDEGKRGGGVILSGDAGQVTGECDDVPCCHQDPQAAPLGLL